MACARAGDKPEVPGYCVREKDLEPCDDDDECQPGTRCLSLGRDASQRYCLPGHGRRPVSPASGSNRDDVTLIGGRLGPFVSS